MDKILRIDMGAAGGPKAKVEPVGAYAGLGGRGLTSHIVASEVDPMCHPLSAANKRIVNILRKAEGEGGGTVDRSALTDGAERALHSAFDTLRPIVESRVADGDFAAALQALASTKPAVDRFFDDVMVMADDPKIRSNRLALLREVAATMNHVADISKLVV
jgi:glycyl-tRNA synthetase beta chain